MCGAALAALGLTACGGGSDGGSRNASSGPSEAVSLGEANEVPVGGGTAYTDEKVVVSQPEKGRFRAFSGVCPHQGAVIDKAEGGEFVCPLHGSRFQVDTGEVARGPASTPLPELEVRVKDGKLVAGPQRES
nr:Rieske (2Fe-2S) protein [Streptomyces boncukensis]